MENEAGILVNLKHNLEVNKELLEIADKLKDRELFPEKIKNAKEYLNNLKPIDTDGK